MTPIEKNVIVVDEQGNEHEATYPRRAKGLVKNGRARFIDENRICLACPPDKISEDKMMEDKNMSMQENTADIAEQTAQTADTAQAAAQGAEAITPGCSLSANEILDAIKSLMFYGGSYLSGAMQLLENLPMSSDDEDIVAYASNMAESIADAVRCRETTNQRALDIYEKMYDDLTKDRERTKYEMMRIMVAQAVEIVSDEGRYELLKAMAKMFTEN